MTVAEACEWNPAINCPAQEGDPWHLAATWSVGAKGQWHLCTNCANLPRFNRYRVRLPLNGEGK